MPASLATYILVASRLLSSPPAGTMTKSSNSLLSYALAGNTCANDFIFSIASLTSILPLLCSCIKARPKVPTKVNVAIITTVFTVCLKSDSAMLLDYFSYLDLFFMTKNARLRGCVYQRHTNVHKNHCKRNTIGVAAIHAD